ncbi:MAG: amino acid ABC transporter permease [Desulfuromonadaceae bacterium]
MGFDVSFFLVALKEAIKYTPVTLFLAFTSLAAGCVIGLALAVARIFQVRLLASLAQAYVVLIKGIPLVILLLMLFHGLTRMFDDSAKALHLLVRAKDVNMIWIAALALSLYAIATISELLRGALLSVGKGQYEAAYSIGLTRSQTFFRVILPQALPVSLPMLCNSLIGLIKWSSIAFVISCVDLLNGALIAATDNYRFLEAYLAAALVYWVLNALIEQIAHRLELHLHRFRKEAAH